jgi:hypothetical protein
MYLQKEISRKIVFCGILKANGENSRIRIRILSQSESGSLPKCPGSATLVCAMLRIRIRRYGSTMISMDPDPSINKQKKLRKPCFLQFVDFLITCIFEDCFKCLPHTF